MLRLRAKGKLCQLRSEKAVCRGLGFQVYVYNERRILENKVKKKKKKRESV